MDYRHSVSIVIQREGKVLVVSSRKWGGFSLPGGKVDPGETFEQAARRELLEETGVEALELTSLWAREHPPVATDPNRNHWLCMCYVAEIGDQEPKQCEEGTIPRWVDPREIANESLYRDFTRQIMTRAGIQWGGEVDTTLSVGEMRAIKRLAQKAASHCGAGEDIIGAILYTGGHKDLHRNESAVVGLAHKIERTPPGIDV